MSTTKASLSRRGRQTYFDLVVAYPLRSIRTLAELRRASKTLDKLMEHEPLNDGDEAYLEALSDLVEHYEEHQVKIPVASDVEVLRHLMESNETTQTELAEAIGIPKSIVSEILKGKRKLARSHIDSLSNRFKVSRDSFAGER